MAATIELARRNVTEGSGGPFGAIVFEQHSGRLVAAGVNLVIREQCSVLHAEIVALLRAQRLVGSYDLGAAGLPAHQLVSSVEPCAMCLGAVSWSGVSELLCGAASSDASRVGFDEGDRPRQWAAALERRGVRVVRGLLRSEAAKVLVEYVAAGGEVYNPRRTTGR